MQSESGQTQTLGFASLRFAMCFVFLPVGSWSGVERTAEIRAERKRPFRSRVGTAAAASQRPLRRPRLSWLSDSSFFPLGEGIVAWI